MTYYDPNVIQDWSRFEQLVKQKEMAAGTAAQLKDILSMCEIVLLCDDSDSMTQPIAEEGTDPFAPKRSTRWLELKKLSATIIEFVTATNANGLDIYFLNREKRCSVNNMIGLQTAFSAQPTGGTPLIGTLRQVYHDKINYASRDRQLLIIVVTDGEPTDGSRTDLFNTLVEITRCGNVHVSFAECTDNAEDMEYLDAWDGCIKNFDNTDDYREELQRVKMAQGMQFKFDYTDYVIKILLATFVRWYFNIDQVKVIDPRNPVNQATYSNTYQSQSQYGNQAYPVVQKIYSPPVQSYNPPAASVQPILMQSQGQQYNMSSSIPQGQPYNAPQQPSVQQYNMSSSIPQGQPYNAPQQPSGQPYSVTTTTVQQPPVQQYSVVQQTSSVYYASSTPSTPRTTSQEPARTKSQSSLQQPEKKSSCLIS